MVFHPSFSRRPRSAHCCSLGALVSPSFTESPTHKTSQWAARRLGCKIKLNSPFSSPPPLHSLLLPLSAPGLRRAWSSPRVVSTAADTVTSVQEHTMHGKDTPRQPVSWPCSECGGCLCVRRPRGPGARHRESGIGRGEKGLWCRSSCPVSRAFQRTSGMM